MGIELGSVEGVIGKSGAFGLLSTLLGDIDKFVKAAGYFTGTGFQEALAKGFMK